MQSTNVAFTRKLCGTSPHAATNVKHGASCGADGCTCHRTVFADICRRGDTVFEVGIRAKKVGAVLRFVDDDLARHTNVERGGHRLSKILSTKA
eukprot:542347-Pyramimonas_sp.AAC.1